MRCAGDVKNLTTLREKLKAGLASPSRMFRRGKGTGISPNKAAMSKQLHVSLGKGIGGVEAVSCRPPAGRAQSQPHLKLSMAHARKSILLGPMLPKPVPPPSTLCMQDFCGLCPVGP